MNRNSAGTRFGLQALSPFTRITERSNLKERNVILLLHVLN